MMTRDRKAQLLMGLMMSLAMSLTLSGFFTLLAFGPGTAWPAAWARSFALGWPIAFLLAQALGGPIRRAALRLAG